MTTIYRAWTKSTSSQVAQLYVNKYVTQGDTPVPVGDNLSVTHLEAMREPQDFFNAIRITYSNMTWNVYTLIDCYYQGAFISANTRLAYWYYGNTDSVATIIFSDTGVVLIEKTITEDGVYIAENDNANGYSMVTVNTSPEPSPEMFDIVFQINSSEKNKLDKSLTDVLTVSGSLKQGTSLIDPVIRIASDVTQLAFVNYATIEIFNRKYFVTDIKTIRKNITEITLHVDVLSTYADSIRNNTGIIHRQENNWNLYLDDGALKAYQNPIIDMAEFPSGFSTPELVLILAGS